MGSENEPAKVLLPYLQRADELQKHELLVAYYCRLYAMDRGLKIPQKDRTKTTNAILVSLMNQLEKDKKSLKLGPDDSLYVEGFASNVFAKADKQDRAGRADLNTAKTFYAASIFFEILNQFGEIHPELEQKQKYAVWKAADIRKALKEGRKPVPGPPGGDKDLSVPTNPSNSEDDLGQNENIFASHHETGAGVPPQSHENVNYQSFPNAPAGHHVGAGESPHQFHEKDNFQNSADLSSSHSGIGSGGSARFHEKSNYQSSGNTSDSSPAYPVNAPPQFPPYPSSDYHPNDNIPTHPSINRQDSSSFPQPYQQPYQQTELPRVSPQNYPSHEFTPPSSYTNFQSYPGFIDHSLPAAPTHAPYYQPPPDVSYPQQSAPSVPSYQSTTQYSSPSRNEKNEEQSTSSQTFHYDSNYMPPPEKIAEAHKAARFAVGALAFDDVAVAVDFLKKSLELLTNPSASH